MLTTLGSMHRGNSAFASLDYRQAWFSRHRAQQREIKAFLETWKEAARHRFHTAPPGSKDKDTYKGLAVTVDVSYLSVCTVFDLPDGKPWDGLGAATAKLLDTCEDVVVSREQAASTSGADESALAQGDALGDQDVLHGGVMIAVAQIAQGSRFPEVRRRAMRLWERMATTTGPGQKQKRQPAWDMQAMILGIKAVLEAEEAQRDPVMDMVPFKAQFYPSGGKWSDDYTEFRVTITAKMPNPDGKMVHKVVRMAALG
ncbi:uncharacterized protein B0I36DRAFT_332592 [Microdochium trichocladiopsis]|uniref:Uncharacterized protein n=1 Tax=Microdochium trichocladiopsis TaxID=1682393 RepID=A0A9P9BM64_9PEZI|nr:uncharacterized protein B0I36DRAFT_332592 [Microdochium trichocladiopsis]KAH7025150.1 hypothetical protein B0I36DRAFT_332592 [Microdochium trichocladiopsis]